jgi:hypothetical protein
MPEQIHRASTFAPVNIAVIKYVKNDSIGQIHQLQIHIH